MRCALFNKQLFQFSVTAVEHVNINIVANSRYSTLAVALPYYPPVILNAGSEIEEKKRAHGLKTDRSVQSNDDSEEEYYGISM